MLSFFSLFLQPFQETAAICTSMNSETDIVQQALSYARRGWPVFPVAKKRPCIFDWPNRATTDAKQIAAWFTDATRGIGLATGSRSGLVVVDIDPRHGGDATLAALIDQHGDIDTVTARTGGDGLHLYFTAPAEPISNSAGKLGHGFDVRAEGGFVVAPPSLHESGQRYAWAEGLALGQVPIAPLPAWIVELVRAPKVVATRPANEWLDLIRSIGEGARNDTLVRLAGRLFRTQLPPELACELVHIVNEARCSPPLTSDEVNRLLESIAKRDADQIEQKRRVWAGLVQHV